MLLGLKIRTFFKPWAGRSTEAWEAAVGTPTPLGPGGDQRRDGVRVYYSHSREPARQEWRDTHEL